MLAELLVSCTIPFAAPQLAFSCSCADLILNAVRCEERDLTLIQAHDNSQSPLALRAGSPFMLWCFPAAIVDIVLSQTCGIILVGDPHQQIYSFRGAVNTLYTVPHTHIYYLTQVR